MRGLIDADLGGDIIKQRVARPGQGKRSGFRMLIGIRPDLAIVLFGFAKNERDNIEMTSLGRCARLSLPGSPLTRRKLPMPSTTDF